MNPNQLMMDALDKLGVRYENHLLPFFWQQGNHHDKLAEQIARIQASGAQAFCLESRTHEDFVGENWWRDLDVILAEAEKRGMEVWILDDKHFPSGYANNFIVKNNRNDLRRWQIIDRHVDVVGPAMDVSLIVPREEDGCLLGVYAYPRTEYDENLMDEPVSLTGMVEGDFLHWDIPEGVWRVFYIYKTQKGICEHCRNFIDMLSEEGVEAFLKTCYEPHFEHYSRYFGKTLRGFFSDEPSFCNTWGGKYITTDYQLYNYRPGQPGMAFPWHESLGEGLKQIYGEEWVSRLPAIWYKLGDASPKLRYSYMDLLTRRYRDNFVRRIGNWCREHNVEYIGHVIEDQNTHARTGYGTGHYFRSEDGQAMSGMDVVLHQVIPGLDHFRHSASALLGYVDSDFYHCVLPQMCASAAALDRKTKGRAMCEVFGAFGWAEGTPFMKWLIDYLLVRGINQFVPHAFSPSFPNEDCPPHFGAEGHDPQFDSFCELMQYTNSLASLLYGGKRISTVALLYHGEAEWGSMDDSERMLMQEPARRLMNAHIAYDIVPIDAIMDDANTADGMLTVHGCQYHALVIPGAAFLPQAFAEKLKTLSDKGMNLFFVEQAPVALPAVKIVSLDGLVEQLRACRCQEIMFSGEEQDIIHYHVKRDGMDVFFLVNASVTKGKLFEMKLPVQGKYLLLDFYRKTVFSAETSDGKAQLKLQPGESRVLVFGCNCLEDYPVQPQTGKEKLLAPTFDISLAEYTDLNVFNSLITTDRLFNIAGKESKPDFSGLIRYDFRVELEAGKCYELDLGEVGQVAKLEVNGQNLGWRYCKPYSFVLMGDFLRDGSNSFRITVGNTLANAKKDDLSFYLQIPRSGLFGPLKLTELA